MVLETVTEPTVRLATRLRDVARARGVEDALTVRPDDDALRHLGEAAARGGAAPLAQRLASIRAWLAGDLIELEAELGSHAPADGDLAERAARHLLTLPGKRIRPLCVVLASRFGAADPVAVRAAAVAAELTHAATLLHDDVIDVAESRRGAPAASVVFGNTASVLGGDHLLIAALRRTAEIGRPELLRELIDTIGDMVAAEAIQLAARARFAPDAASYHAVVRGKTAALFRWSLRAGGTLGGLEAPAVDALGRAGTALGFAFQLVDDALDLAEDAVTGKDVAADLREGKLTWPLLVACERDPGLRAAIEAAFDGQLSLEAAPVTATLVERIRASGAVAATRERARAFARTAQVELTALPAGPAREALEAVIGAAVARRA